MNGEIRHLVVLMLENRSFDHMLGYLDHPDPSLERLTGEESNLWIDDGPPVRVSPFATRVAAADPDHSHRAVMYQLTGKRAWSSPYAVDNSGFGRSYEEVCRDPGRKPRLAPGTGATIMLCQNDPGYAPNLATLARGFAVCDHWFCSVPGQTWPNRNFAAAATSDGEVDIVKRPYFNCTLYELLQAHGRTWRIYHDGIPHLWAFPKLWKPQWRRGFRDLRRLFDDIAGDSLPDFSFIEPDHFWPGSSSQHPSHNLAHRGSGADFRRADELIGRVYGALRARPEVFDKTLLLITYDEHGGFYDHVEPPQGPRFTVPDVYRDGGYTFPFDILGPRVPAVLVSPWIEEGRIDARPHDHAAIPETARCLFAPDAAIPAEWRRSTSFADLVSRDTPRRGEELPILAATEALAPEDAEETESLAYLPVREMDEFALSLLWLGERVQEALRAERAGVDVTTEELWTAPEAIEPIAPAARTFADAAALQASVLDAMWRSAEEE